MKKRYFFIIIYVLIAFFIVFSNTISVNADLSEIYSDGEIRTFTDATTIILSYVQWVGLAILFGVIIVKGTKYLTSAPEGKAEIKKDLVMIVVGMILLLLTVTVVRILRDVAFNSGLQGV